MDAALLESLNLNKNEILLYKTMLKTGKITAPGVAKVTKLKRTTAYGIARSLVEKGLLIEEASSRPAVFSLADAEEVLRQITKEKKLFSEREDVYKKIAAEISKVNLGNEYQVPTVRFVKEEQIDEFLRKQSLVWDKSMLESSEKTWWGFQDHTFVESFGGWIAWYWKQSPKIIDLKLLSNRAKTEVDFSKNTKHLERRKLKFWEDSANFESTTWAIGDYVVMINTRNHPFYLVEIHDKRMAHDQREVFRGLWDMV